MKISILCRSLLCGIFVLIIPLLISSTHSANYPDKVTVRISNDPYGIHPHTTTGASATEVKRLMHARLLEVDHESLELTPFLARNLPVIEKINDGKGLQVTYEIREEANWDDGTPITADDVEFSFKAVKNPKVNAANLRPYFDFIVGFERYPDNPKKFTFICDQVYFLADYQSGYEVIIVPKHLYDSDGLSDKISFAQIVEGKEEMMNSAENMAFVEMYNAPKFNREPSFAYGAGAYKLTAWETGERLKLERKKDWWGNSLKGKGMYFDDGPAEVVFEVILLAADAVKALEEGELDVVTGIPMADWLELPAKSEKYRKNFKRTEIPAIGYNYIGYNLRDNKLKDKRTRHAFDHLLDLQKIIDELNYGVGIPISHGIMPAEGAHIYKEIPRREYNPEKAKALLKEAGWIDENENGILDQRFDGELTELSLKITYPYGSKIGQNWIAALKEAFEEAGIEVIADPVEWVVLLESLKNHELDMWLGAWIMDPRPSDPRKLWHTDSYENGANYTGFGNEETDAIIESITTAMTKEEQTELYHKWQDIQFDEAPYLFLWRGWHRISSHKRFGDIKPTQRNPGFHPGYMQLAPGYK